MNSEREALMDPEDAQAHHRRARERARAGFQPLSGIIPMLRDKKVIVRGIRYSYLGVFREMYANHALLNPCLMVYDHDDEPSSAQTAEVGAHFVCLEGSDFGLASGEKWTTGLAEGKPV